jgi:hypothetical protein
MQKGVFQSSRSASTVDRTTDRDKINIKLQQVWVTVQAAVSTVAHGK